MAPYPRQSWIATNLTSKELIINDIPELPAIPAKKNIDLLQYTTIEKINNSLILNNYARKKLIKVEPYFHTHDDKSDITHIISSHIDTFATGPQLNILVKGPNSNADFLHTHNIFSNNISNINENISEIQINLTNILNKTKNFISEEDLISYLTPQEETDPEEPPTISSNIALRSDSINQFIDVNITGNLLDTLTNGSNADSLHNHNLSGIKDVTTTKSELNIALHGIDTSTVLAKNLTTLTDGSDADALHYHLSENLWDREGTTLVTTIPGDNLRIDGNVYLEKIIPINPNIGIILDGDVILETIIPRNPSIGIVIDGNVSITGTTYLDKLEISGNLIVSGTTILEGDLYCYQNVILDTIIPGNAYDGVTLEGNLTVTGDLFASIFKDSSLRGFYQFVDDAKDSSIYGNDGSTSYGAPTYVNDVVDLDGDDGIDLVASNVLSPNNNSWTQSLWFQSDIGSPIASQIGLLTLVRSGGGSGTNIQFNDAGTDFLEARIRNNEGGWTSLSGGSLATLGTSWHHIIFSYDGTNLKLYIDGILKDSITSTFTGFSSDIAQLGHKGGTSYFNGRMDDVMIYDRVSTPQEIYNLYSKQSKNFGYFNDFHIGGPYGVDWTPGTFFSGGYLEIGGAVRIGYESGTTITAIDGANDSLNIITPGIGNINLSPGGDVFVTSGDFLLNNDNQKAKFGTTNTDLQIYSDGTDGQFDATGDIFFNPTGNVKFGTAVAIGVKTITEYITIKDAAGATRYLAVVS